MREARIKSPGNWESSATVLALLSKALGPQAGTSAFLELFPSLSRIWLFVTPWTVARQAPLSLGFPRQNYWSGLPVPSPYSFIFNDCIYHLCIILYLFTYFLSCRWLPVYCYCVRMCGQSCLIATPWTIYSLPGSFVHGILQARILEWVVMSSPRGIFPTQGSNPCLLRLLRWQAGSLPLASPGKPKNWKC